MTCLYFKKVRSKKKKIFDRTLFLSAFTLLSKPFFRQSIELAFQVC